MKKSMRTIPLVLLAATIVVFTACGQSDTATVTINVGLNEQANLYQPSLVERLLSLLSLSSKLEADAPDLGALGIDELESIELEVTGPGMEKIGEPISPATGVLTVEVPAGAQRKFTVILRGTRYVAEYSGNFYGGHVIEDLDTGDTRSLNIQMLAIPINVNANQTGADEISVQCDPTPLADSYNVYRSLAPEGPYVKVGSMITTLPFADMGLAYDTTYYYRMSANFSIQGEGELSDFTSGYVGRW